MQINRFYLDQIVFDQFGIQKLPGDISKQLIYVLRSQINDQVVLFDGTGYEYSVQIIDVSNKICSVKLLEKVSIDYQNKIHVTIFLSLIKQNRFENALQKCTELGAVAFVPFYSSRSKYQLDKESSSIGKNKIVRWESIIKEASEQCGRSDIPNLFDPISFELVCKKAQDSFSIILWENEQKTNLKSILKGFRDDRKDNESSINIIVGPEGGFSPDEIMFASNKGIKSGSLGNLILRSETAAISAISNIFYELSETI